MALTDQEKQELAQLEDMVQRAQSQVAPQQVQQQPEQPGMMQKGWDALNKPSEMSRDGLNQLMDLHTQGQNALAAKTGLPIGTEPTGNMTRDIVANVPRIAGETVAEFAPSMIDRTSMLLSGAGMAAKGASKAVGAVLPKVAPMLEAGSGLQKGTLVAAFKDPSMIADFGAKAKASALYNSIKEGSEVPAQLRTNAGLVKGAVDEMAKGNVLDARDAFKARKAVNALLKAKDSAGSFPKDDLYKVKEGLEAMVSGSTKEADQMYVRAIRGEQMRNVARLNKNGTSGPVGQAALALLPTWAKFLGSPALQGGLASGAGAMAQANPAGIMNTSALVAAGLDRLRRAKGERP